jgi:Ca-activated chloride channel family protein
MAIGSPGLGLQSPAQSHFPPDYNTEEYAKITDNPFLGTLGNPLSTFSIDVDTASYANVRRYLLENRSLPIPDAVRIEELLNYFPYSYAPPAGKDRLAYSLALAQAPWNKDNELLRVAVKAAEIDAKDLPPSNLVFLLDCSGSMADNNKLPLLKDGLKILVRNLRPRDKVSIVVYAGRAGLILPPTPGDKYERIVQAIDGLAAGGSTAGGEGIQLAYRTAKDNYIKGGNNRVILATDGDFNVGISSTSELERYIEKEREENIYLTVLGLGMGNYKDNRMETLADKGNGSYAYIDNLLEARKVLGKEIWGSLFTVAKDVKLQIEFNPALVREYRLIGYENRLLAKEDFNDDRKDAGEMGSGQTVTALYELVLAEAAGGPVENEAKPGAAPAVDPLVFQDSAVKPSDDLLVFKLRYKVPGEGNEASLLLSSRLAKSALAKSALSEAAMDKDFAFASAVAEFGMLLRDSPYKAGSSWASLIERARSAKGLDFEGYRAEFVRLAELAQTLAAK